MPEYELHIAKNVREKYKLNKEFFTLRGELIFTNSKELVKLVRLFNVGKEEKKQITVGEVFAVGLIDEIIHFVINEYDSKLNPRAVKRAVEKLKENFSEEKFAELLKDFNTNFPPLNVYLKRETVDEYLKNYFGEKSNVEISVEEIILLYLENFNPATRKLRELFDENYLSRKDEFRKTISNLKLFFENERRIGPELLDLFAFLQMPFVKYPDDLLKQLEYIEKNWKFILKEKFSEFFQLGKNIFEREARLFWQQKGGKPPALVPQYKTKGETEGKKEGYEEEYPEEEKFTPDVDWMPKVVLIAKNTFVWLDQLSKKYNRKISRLDEIPDEELELLASWNINALWLIGIWERSSASKKIKHLTGNIDAVASAYSLYDYTIAEELGGEEAYENLHKRASAMGIRLASDMVPNHTGIYSDWTINRPEYFIQRKDVPFDVYSFTGPDLSEHPDIEIKIEDGYYSKTDAAVVFKWFNKRTNETRFIYHGNDGTNMPWNDTAQLDMLKKEVREAVIQKILEVADKFPIIRFDAAMTLAKRHFKRLWYPDPKAAEGIPSRSEYSMSKQEFDKLFPKEFWREVVDRINSEKPETLLLAEAFWLMEGYFVRTLGMHRVYNSAFMNMMMNEENKKYRQLISNTLEFDPEILKRYVNFMSNPDEETAIKQFGEGDKYFGVCLLMVTLPGLPMFAHGQIEGFTEKYGMEYKRAYYDEKPNEYLIERHKREIFPLLGKRFLFSEVENFNFYDFVDSYGAVNENVFAFTNKYKDEKVLVVYNNKYDRAFGFINKSVQKLNKIKGNLESATIWKEFNILHGSDYFYKATDLTTGKEFLFSGEEICCNGIKLSLNGFQYFVFYGFEEIYDRDGYYRKLFEKLSGQGCDSIEKQIKLLRLEPIHFSFVKIFEHNLFSKFVTAYEEDENNANVFVKNLLGRINDFNKNLGSYLQEQINFENIGKEYLTRFNSIIELNQNVKELLNEQTDVLLANVEHSVKTMPKNNYKENLQIILLYFILKSIREKYGTNLINDLLLYEKVEEILRFSGFGERGVHFEETLIRTLSEIEFKFNNVAKYEFINPNNGKFKKAKARLIYKTFSDLLKTDLVQNLLNVHEYNETYYYSKENFEDLVNWLFTLSLVEDVLTLNKAGKRINKRKRFSKMLKAKYLIVQKLNQISVNSEYKWKVLNKAIEKKSLP